MSSHRLSRRRARPAKRALAAAVFALVAAGAARAHADLTTRPPEPVKEPLALTFVGHEAFPGREVVVLGCGYRAPSGPHMLQFAPPSGVVTCTLKQIPAVYVVGPEEAKALRALVAKNLGTSYEARDASRLLSEKAMLCGTTYGRAYAGQPPHPGKAVAASYRIEAKGPNGCSLVELALGVAPPPSPAAPSTVGPTASPRGSSSPSASPDGASPATATSAAPPGNGGCSGCSLSRPGRVGAAIASLLFAGALLALTRRRPPSAR